MEETFCARDNPIDLDPLKHSTRTEKLINTLFEIKVKPTRRK
jgi:hypothetical protein